MSDNNKSSNGNNSESKSIKISNINTESLALKKMAIGILRKEGLNLENDHNSPIIINMNFDEVLSDPVADKVQKVFLDLGINVEGINKCGSGPVDKCYCKTLGT
jgi:hypothetical protein